MQYRYNPGINRYTTYYRCNTGTVKVQHRYYKVKLTDRYNSGIIHMYSTGIYTSN